MLKNIHPLLGAELLGALAAMGHGDELVIVDRNFPAASTNKRVIALAGTTSDQAIEAILTVFPLDTFIEPAAWHMAPVDDPSASLPVHRAAQAALARAEGRAIELAPLERFEFYRRAASAFAMVTTTEGRSYGCFLLTKGVV